MHLLVFIETGSTNEKVQDSFPIGKHEFQIGGKYLSLEFLKFTWLDFTVILSTDN